ncbi:SNF2 helicase associated domain-containing protein [Paenibacillaceae bacterium WGS1546]|uniref:DEAD/DEAH box helicase n=1 Tax=Cohnella sp. WGS1546 TaxID=3366810 RepID=UPI00372D74EC
MNLQSLREMCGEAAYARGEAYYRSGQVAAVKREADGASYRVVVNGSNRDRHEVEIVFDRDGAFEASCDCASYAPLSYCQHIVAALFRLLDAEADRSPAEEEEISERDLRLTKQAIFMFDKAPGPGIESERIRPEEGDRRTLATEFGFKLVKSFAGKTMFAASMKIGHSRLYVVQKIKEFLKRVEAGEPMPFAKQFAYDPAEHAFSEPDAQMIALLTEAMNAEEIYRDLFHSLSSYAYREEKLLAVPPSLWTRMLPLLGTLNARFEDKSGIHPLETIEGELPVSARLDRAGEGYVFAIEGLKNTVVLDDYGVAIANGLVFRAEAEPLKRLSELKKLFREEQRTRLLIPPDQIEPFINRVVHGLKQAIPVRISPPIADRIVSPPLAARLHLDMKDDRLLARLEYAYDDIVISPLPRAETQNAKPDVLLMRDLDREYRIMALIERASFKFNGKDVYLDREEEIYDFLYGILPLLKDVDVRASDAVRSAMDSASVEPRARVDVDAGTNWLEVTFDMEGMEEEEIRNVLRSLVEKKKYYRLPGGRFLSLERDGFREIARLFEELDLDRPHAGDARIRLPAIRGLRLMDRYGAAPGGVQVGESLRKLWDHLRHPEQLEFEVPGELAPVLRDYQKLGFRWLKTLSHYGLGGILADDMGLGKTIQSIAYIASESGGPEDAGRPSPAPTLIVCPASLVFNWQREIERFAPHLRTVAAAGDPRERSDLMAGGGQDADVWITSYPLLRRDIDWYERRTFRALFLDEAQAIKNSASLTAHAVRRLRAGQRFALTGTPIENALEELWSIFEAIVPGLFGSRKAFSGMPRDKIARIVRPFILRRLKSDVLKELPDKIESLRPSELTLEQKRLYLAYLERLQSDVARDLAEADGFRRNRMKILAGLTRLRQLCCHPALFLEGYEGGSGKLEQLLELIGECRSGGKRLLVFSQFTSMLELIRGELDGVGIPYFLLDGSTPSAERVDMCEAFNAGERDLFLISLRAGGTGLNLTGADTVVLFDLWWNPAVEQQAADRAHRIGQKKVVHVIKLVAQGTIEEKILALQRRKKDLIDEIVQSGESSLTALTEDDIREMLGLRA